MTETNTTASTTTETQEHHNHPHAPEEQGEMENIIAFLKDNKLDINKMGKDYNTSARTFQRVLRRINIDLVRIYEQNQSVPLEVVEDEMLRYVRSKLKQGKPWSRGFIQAITLDYKIALEKALAKRKTAETATPVTEVATNG